MESPETPSTETTTRGGGTTTSRVDELMPHLLDALLSPSPALQTLLANLDPTRPRPDLSRPSRRPRRRHPDRTPAPARIVSPVEVDTAGDDKFTLRIVVAYCNGKTQQQIANSYGVHVQTVRKRLRDAGVVVRGHLAVLTRDEIATIRAAHAEGTSARELGRRYSVAHTTILRHLRRPATR